MLYAAQDDIRLMTQTGNGFAKLKTEFGEIMAAQVSGLEVFQVVPDTLGWVQVRGIAGQTFQMDTVSCALGEEVSDRLTLMSRQAIWRLQAMASKMRPTWRGEYLTPYSRSITLATRPWVHTSPRKPKCSAPLANNSGSPVHWSSLSRGLGPPPRRWRNPSTPSSLARFTHWLTAPVVTPSTSAISFCFKPFLLQSPALLSPLFSPISCLFCLFLSHEDTILYLASMFRKSRQYQ